MVLAVLAGGLVLSPVVAGCAYVWWLDRLMNGRGHERKRDH